MWRWKHKTKQKKIIDLDPKDQDRAYILSVSETLVRLASHFNVHHTYTLRAKLQFSTVDLDCENLDRGAVRSALLVLTQWHKILNINSLFRAYLEFCAQRTGTAMQNAERELGVDTTTQSTEREPYGLQKLHGGNLRRWPRGKNAKSDYTVQRWHHTPC